MDGRYRSAGDSRSRSVYRSGSDHGGFSWRSRRRGGRRACRALIDMGIAEYEAIRHEGKVKTGTSCSLSIPRIAKSAIVRRRSSRPVALYISLIPARLLFPRNSGQPLAERQQL